MVTAAAVSVPSSVHHKPDVSTKPVHYSHPAQATHAAAAADMTAHPHPLGAHPTVHAYQPPNLPFQGPSFSFPFTAESS